MTGTYDPELNLIYWGTGNPTPVLNGSTRPGDNLYTCSIVAINPDTGKLAWAFQVSPHDTHDWDAVEIPVLVDGEFHGQPRKMVMQASRNGYFVVVDRTNGKNLLSIPYGPVNWSLGVDKNGNPIPNPKKEPAPDGRLIAPDEGGLTNYRSPSFDPQDGIIYCRCASQLQPVFCEARRRQLWLGGRGLWPLGQRGASRRSIIRPEKFAGRHEGGRNGDGAGVLTTDSGLTFTGDEYGNMLALETRDGKNLVARGHGRGHADFSDHL